MYKALIVAFCGLIVALVIGATTFSANPKKPASRVFIEQKCIEAVEPDALHKDCAEVGFPREKVYAEKFLRQFKRKAKVAFA